MPVVTTAEKASTRQVYRARGPRPAGFGHSRRLSGSGSDCDREASRSLAARAALPLRRFRAPRERNSRPMPIVTEADRVAATGERRSIAVPGILLGLGLGGFVDGIVLHQLLQWHHLISSTEKGDMDTVAGLEANTLADGLFHAGTWLLTAAGLWWLWTNVSRRRVRPDREFLGWLFVGWGLFNIADEVVNHALLDLHHIREGPDELAYDMVFLALGIAQLLVGWLLTRSGRAVPIGPHG
jgi:uncharacterized membrane protein